VAARARPRQGRGRAFKKKSPKQSFPANRIEALAQAGAFDAYIDRELTLVQKPEAREGATGGHPHRRLRQVFARNETRSSTYMEDDEPTEGYEDLARARARV
jgi:DNA polymerase III alpha subunit